MSPRPCRQSRSKWDERPPKTCTSVPACHGLESGRLTSCQENSINNRHDSKKHQDYPGTNENYLPARFWAGMSNGTKMISTGINYCMRIQAMTSHLGSFAIFALLSTLALGNVTAQANQRTIESSHGKGFAIAPAVYYSSNRYQTPETPNFLYYNHTERLWRQMLKRTSHTGLGEIPHSGPTRNAQLPCDPIAAHDFNGDGIDDLVCNNGFLQIAYSRFSITVNDSFDLGAFYQKTPAPIVKPGSNEKVSLSTVVDSAWIADLNGDGNQDILLRDLNNSVLMVLLDEEEGIIGRRSFTPPAGTGLVIGALNHGTGNSAARVYFAANDGTLTRTTLTLTGNPSYQRSSLRFPGNWKGITLMRPVRFAGEDSDEVLIQVSDTSYHISASFYNATLVFGIQNFDRIDQKPAKFVDAFFRYDDYKLRPIIWMHVPFSGEILQFSSGAVPRIVSASFYDFQGTFVSKLLYGYDDSDQIVATGSFGGSELYTHYLTAKPKLIASSVPIWQDASGAYAGHAAYQKITAVLNQPRMAALKASAAVKRIDPNSSECIVQRRCWSQDPPRDTLLDLGAALAGLSPIYSANPQSPFSDLIGCASGAGLGAATAGRTVSTTAAVIRRMGLSGGSPESPTGAGLGALMTMGPVAAAGAVGCVGGFVFSFAMDFGASYDRVQDRLEKNACQRGETVGVGSGPEACSCQQRTGDPADYWVPICEGGNCVCRIHNNSYCMKITQLRRSTFIPSSGTGNSICSVTDGAISATKASQFIGYFASKPTFSYNPGLRVRSCFYTTAGYCFNSQNAIIPDVVNIPPTMTINGTTSPGPYQDANFRVEAPNPPCPGMPLTRSETHLVSGAVTCVEAAEWQDGE